MENNAEIKLYSRRNDVTLIFENGTPRVRKRFADERFYERERECYALLRERGLHVPELLRFSRGEITLEFINGKTALELLETQESEETPELTPWRDLALWCCAFYRETGLSFRDPNLRNFIMDDKTRLWYGIDFECCEKGDRNADFALLLAFTKLYRPENTALKRKVTAVMRETFCSETHADETELKWLQECAEEELAARRRLRREKICENPPLS